MTEETAAWLDPDAEQYERLDDYFAAAGTGQQVSANRNPSGQADAEDGALFPVPTAPDPHEAVALRHIEAYFQDPVGRAREHPGGEQETGGRARAAGALAADRDPVRRGRRLRRHHGPGRGTADRQRADPHPGFPSAGPAAARRGVGEEWHKPNAMPEPVTDQLATRYEHLFLLTRSPRYWFDLREPATRPGRLLGAAWPRA